MAKKEMDMYHGCHCMGWMKVVGGVIAAVLGLLMIWPRGWFTFEHSFGLLVFLMGLKFIAWGFHKPH